MRGEKHWKSYEWENNAEWPDQPKTDKEEQVNPPEEGSRKNDEW